MTANLMTPDYSALDRPEVLHLLFHPRQEWPMEGGTGRGLEVLIPVATEVRVGGRFHVQGPEAPDILFFHGNGEIVGDYDELGPIYNRLGLNFLAVDYRGYGRSSGSPTVSAMMGDSHAILDFVVTWRKEKGHRGPLLVMGRSLGSASALELAARRLDLLDGLVIESGFAYAAPLLSLLGVPVDALSFREEKGFANLDKIRVFDKPTLIIHAERDHIIPFAAGQALYEASPARHKTLLKIPRANHNDIFAHAFREYMEAVKRLAEQTARP
jgi:fermentation-respiration switch protein FrsA (DUF1100 family)